MVQRLDKPPRKKEKTREERLCSIPSPIERKGERGGEKFLLRFYFIAREDPLEFIVKWIADRAKGIQASSSRLMGNCEFTRGRRGV